MHGMKNKSSIGLLWMRQWSSQIRKRRVLHINSARHGLLLWDITFSHKCWWRLRPVDWRRVMDVSVERSIGLMALKMKVNWPVERAKRPTWL